jgi:hypothetical protein
MWSSSLAYVEIVHEHAAASVCAASGKLTGEGFNFNVHRHDFCT